MTADNDLLKTGETAMSQVASEAYKDLAQPSARRLGTAIESLFKVALSPVALLDWGFEQSKDWLKSKISQRLANTPEEFVSPPPNNIAIPALIRIAMSHDTPELRDLYAELLLKAMDSRTAGLVHPAYVSVIEQLSPEEALVFISLQPKADRSLFEERFSPVAFKSSPSIEEQFEDYCRSLGVENPCRAQVWLENLKRLGLLELLAFSEATYVPQTADRHGFYGPRVENTENRHIQFTAFGQGFIDACAPIV